MNRFRTWSLSVVTMVLVATTVLLVTGWGSAIASSLSVTPVIVKNTTTNPAIVRATGTVTVNGSVAVAGTPSVSVTNLRPAPTTQVIVHESGHVSAYTPFLLVGGFTAPVNLAAYRSVTLYLDLSQTADPGEACQIHTYDPDGNDYLPGTFDTGTTRSFSKTLDPAPPNLVLYCIDNSGLDFDYHFMLTGRTD
jgi:hypothetical protein